MTYDLPTINRLITKSPLGYVLESEKHFNFRIRKAAEALLDNVDRSPIVLLSGPSGSGKTTTAKKLVKELAHMGILAHNVSLDNYFFTVDPLTAPKTPSGDIDYESPDCLDTPLLNSHFRKLAAGEEIEIPHFSFSKQERVAGRLMPLKLAKNELAIFEGIHALNESITREHPSAFKIYVSTLTDFSDRGNLIIDCSGLRLIRRIVRDDFFRGADPQFTLNMWKNIRRGEQLNILPYKDTANMTIDSALPYEVAVLKQYTGTVFEKVPEDTAHFEDLRPVLNAFHLFMDIDSSYVPSDSIIREFIGGSEFSY